MDYLNIFAMSLNDGNKNGNYKVNCKVDSENKVLNYKGIQVYKRTDKHFIYIKDGICVMERVGVSKTAINDFNNNDQRVKSLMNKYNVSYK